MNLVLRQEEPTLPWGKLVMGLTACFALVIGGVKLYADQAAEHKAEAFFTSAQDQVRLEQPSDALVSINHALDLKEKPEFLNLKATLLIDEGKVFEADSVLKKLVTYQPKEPQYRYMLSTMALNEDDLDKAVKYMQEARDLEPNNPTYAVGLANLLYRQGKAEQAKALYEAVIQKDPNYKYAWEQYANALSNSGFYQEALAIDRRSLKHFPKDFEPYFLMATTYDHMGEKQKAVAAYRKSLELYPIENSIAAKRIYEITGHKVPARLEKIVTDDIPFDSIGNVMYVQAQVNEQSGRFLIDTGASVCVLYQHAAQKYHLTPSPYKIAVQTANGVIQVPLAYGDIQLGESRVSKVVIGIAPDPKSNASDGIIGMNFMNHFQMDIDKNRHTITLAHTP